MPVTPADTAAKRAPDWVHSGSVPRLDALRAVAVFLVLVAHWNWDAPLSRFVGPVFRLGVTLFFTLSGFSMTLLLLREHATSGTVSLGEFYRRRILRTFPSYYVYVIVSLGLAALGSAPIKWKYFGAAAAYVMCYMPHLENVRNIAHASYLAVELHFSLIWPVVLLCAGMRRAGQFLLVYVCGAPLLRYGIWALHIDWLDIDFASITEMSSAATGALLAFVVRREFFPRVGRWLSALPLFWAVSGMALLVLSHELSRSGKYRILLIDPVAAIGCTMIVGGLVLAQSTISNRALDNRVTASLGAISYNLILWQQPFVDTQIFGSYSPGWLRLVAAVAAATASYHLVEKPFLQLAERWRSEGSHRQTQIK